MFNNDLTGAARIYLCPTARIQVRDVLLVVVLILSILGNMRSYSSSSSSSNAAYSKMIRQPAANVASIDEADMQASQTVQPTLELESVRYIIWLHFPNVGTTFLNTLYHYACPRVPDGAGVGPDVNSIFHLGDLTVNYPRSEWCDIPLEVENLKTESQGDLLTEDGEDVFAMFRDPYPRLLSSFHDLVLHGKPLRDQYKIRSEIKQQQSEEAKFRMYLKNDVLGCQTKMVLGIGCCQRYKLTSRKLKHAKRIISRMKFVGISSEWNRSICLFHKQFGGEILPLEIKADKVSDENDMEPYHEKIIFDGSDVDAFDEELYHHVKLIVYERFKLYGC